MQGLQRKVVHAVLFEALAIVSVTAALSGVGEGGAAHASVLAVLTSVVALLWNMVYNTLFEAWESRQARLGRGLARRVAHAVGFEAGLVVLVVPLISWWMDMGLWQALLLDLGLVLYFLLYTLVFNWAFDRVFGLPAAARAAR